MLYTVTRSLSAVGNCREYRADKHTVLRSPRVQFALLLLGVIAAFIAVARFAPTFTVPAAWAGGVLTGVAYARTTAFITANPAQPRRAAHKLDRDANQRLRTEPPPPTGGSEQQSLITMYWTNWGKLLWRDYGTLLLDRERDIQQWATDTGRQVRVAAPEVLSGQTSVPALFLDDDQPALMYARNATITNMNGYRVLLADTNRYLVPKPTEEQRLSIRPTTSAMTAFPERQSLIVTPRRPGQIDQWLRFVNVKVPTGDPDFDQKYDVYASSVGFATTVLSKAIRNELLLWDRVRIVADREVLVVTQLGEWVAPEHLDALAGIAAALSRQATKTVSPARLPMA